MGTKRQVLKAIQELPDDASAEDARWRDGEAFVVRPSAGGGSPLDVPGADAGFSRQEIGDWVRKSRQSSERFLKGTTPPSKRLRPAARRARRD